MTSDETLLEGRLDDEKTIFLGQKQVVPSRIGCSILPFKVTPMGKCDSTYINTSNAQREEIRRTAPSWATGYATSEPIITAIDDKPANIFPDYAHEHTISYLCAVTYFSQERRKHR